MHFGSSTNSVPSRSMAKSGCEYWQLASPCRTSWRARVFIPKRPMCPLRPGGTWPAKQSGLATASRGSSPAGLPRPARSPSAERTRPLIAQRFPLVEARRAQKPLEKGGVVGKIVLVANDSSQALAAAQRWDGTDRTSCRMVATVCSPERLLVNGIRMSASDRRATRAAETRIRTEGAGSAPLSTPSQSSGLRNSATCSRTASSSAVRGNGAGSGREPRMGCTDSTSMAADQWSAFR